MKALLASIPINIHADYTTNPMQTQCSFVVHHTSSARARLRFDRLIREKLEGETVKRELCSGEIDPVGWLDVNVLSHQTCSTGRAFPAP